MLGCTGSRNHARQRVHFGLKGDNSFSELRLPEGTREQASELRAEVAARIAVLELRGLPAQADDIDLRLDGRSVPTHVM